MKHNEQILVPLKLMLRQDVFNNQPSVTAKTLVLHFTTVMTNLMTVCSVVSTFGKGIVTMLVLMME